ncbi:MAG: hypothetical protein WC227_00885 [Patescibacteria group bacterium]|jgi:hypothetical protein
MTTEINRGKEMEKVQNTRDLFFYPEGEGANNPIRIIMVGSSESSKDEQKKEMGQIVAEESAKGMAKIVEKGKKVLWSMATGSTFNWPENLPVSLEQTGVDPKDIIPIVKEDAWDQDRNHFPSGNGYDFRGKRINSFHKLFGLEPKNVSVSDGQIEGNIVAPDYDMSPEQAVDYMNETWSALTKTGQVEGFTTTGVGEDMHVGEFQINKMGLENQIKQMDFFLQPVNDYSDERGLFRWLKNPEEFAKESNVFVERGKEGWQATGRTAKLGEDIVGGTVMGMGWRAMLETPGGAVFAFDSGSKALAARSAIQGSLSGVIKDSDGIEVLKVEAERGEGIGIWDDLAKIVGQYEEDGILEHGYFDKIMASSETENSKIGLINNILEDIYSAYIEKNISPQKPEQNEKYFQPLWRLVNRYLGYRSPVSLWVSQLQRRGTPVTLVITRQAAAELPSEMLV